MKRSVNITALALGAAIFLTACNSGSQIRKELNVIKPVDSYYTKEVKEYTDEGIKEEVTDTVSSAD